MKRVTLFVHLPEQEDYAEQWLWADGASSVSSKPPGHPDRSLEAMYDELDEVSFHARLEEAARSWPGEVPPAATSEVDEKNWQVQWRENFTPLQAGRFRLVGEWEDLPADDDTIWIYPGQAFGTGQHETTRLVLEHMETIPFDRTRVLDIGCGTGILSIAAEKLGAAEVFGFDADPDCAENMAHHLRINESRHIELSIGTLDDFSLASGSYDVILANITLNVLREVWPLCKGLLKPKGHLISSGILLEQKEEAEAQLLDLGFDIYRHTGLGEWVMLAARIS